MTSVENSDRQLVELTSDEDFGPRPWDLTDDENEELAQRLNRVIEGFARKLKRRHPDGYKRKRFARGLSGRFLESAINCAVDGACGRVHRELQQETDDVWLLMLYATLRDTIDHQLKQERAKKKDLEQDWV